MFRQHLLFTIDQKSNRTGDRNAISRRFSFSLFSSFEKIRRPSIDRSGEIVPFPKTVRPRGAVEQWLTSVEQAMFDSVKHYLKLGLNDPKSRDDYLEWIVQHPGQVVLTISQVIYTRDVNQSFEDGENEALIRIRDQMVTTINKVCALVFTELEETKLLTVEALLTLQVHWRDIFEVLIQNNVRRQNKSSIRNENFSSVFLFCVEDSRQKRFRMAKTSSIRLERSRKSFSDSSS